MIWFSCYSWSMANELSCSIEAANEDKTILGSQRGRSRKIILNMDINKTILISDAAAGIVPTAMLNR